MGIKAALIIGLLSISTPATADWQYTRWGMTEAQVTTASKGKMLPCNAECRKHSSDDLSARLFSNYTAGEYSFLAVIQFDRRTERLAAISLILKEPSQGFKLASDLRGKYGQPLTHQRTSLTEFYEWNDAKDRVSLFLIGNGPSSATLMYRPRVTAATKGL